MKAGSNSKDIEREESNKDAGVTMPLAKETGLLDDVVLIETLADSKKMTTEIKKRV